jgi:hypothetical protein
MNPISVLLVLLFCIFAFNVLNFFTFGLLRRGLNWTWRAVDAHSTRQGKLPPLWKFRQWIIRPLWGYRRWQVFTSCLAAYGCAWTVLTMAGPLSPSPLVFRSDVSASTSELTKLYGTPDHWLAPPKHSSSNAITDRYTKYPFPRLHLAYASGLGQQHDLAGVIICENLAEETGHECRLNIATPLHSPAEALYGRVRGTSPARIATVFSTHGNEINAIWHQSRGAFSKAAGRAALEGGGTLVRLGDEPATIARNWLIAAARGTITPAITMEWPDNGVSAPNRYSFSHDSEQLLFAAFLRVSELADQRILLNHDLHQLKDNVLRDYVTIFGHLDRSPEIAQLLSGPMPDSNNSVEIARALARQPQVAHLYNRRDVHAEGIYEKLLADLTAIVILP